MSKSSSLRVLPGLSVANLSAQKIGPYLAGTPIPVWALDPYTNTYSAAFDGTDSKYTTNSALVTSSGESVSFSFWAKAERYNQQYLYSGTTSGIDVYSYSTGHFRVVFYVGGVAHSVYDPALNNTFHHGTYRHIAIVYDNGATNVGEVYVDGVSKATYATNFTFEHSTPLNIGGGNSWLDGNIDEVAIWRGTALSGVEVAAIHSAGGGNPLVPKPTHHYTMGDIGADSPTVMTDYIGHLDCTGYGGPIIDADVPT